MKAQKVKFEVIVGGKKVTYTVKNHTEFNKIVEMLKIVNSTEVVEVTRVTYLKVA